MSDKPPAPNTIQPDDCCIQNEDGSYALVIPVMAEQLFKFQAWANHVSVPLDQFMREAADHLCTQNAEDLAIAEHERAVDRATLSNECRVVLH